ncbi:four helix bundle protein [Brevifollis gellanilyticus]|uniref:Four helix bundle protein n=1 Tax=Brevifollis gellanilyticus TaxID=748831 RepID=A0A512M8P1_9BACT|nr:four helix bundle protein [Brevifollis gellanilyticus]GEP42731.1 four helix bundle protein [Brevifollis gellanilyticus]
MNPERKNPIVQSYRDLEVYKAAFQFQQAIFQVSKRFPKEEMYSLTDQVRRSSRSIGANIAEAWSKRSYEAHFRSKLTDADGELQESTHWIDTAIACEYITEEQYQNLLNQLGSVGAMLGRMIANHRAFCY